MVELYKQREMVEKDKLLNLLQEGPFPINTSKIEIEISETNETPYQKDTTKATGLCYWISDYLPVVPIVVNCGG